jgi:hypothetical protein
VTLDEHDRRVRLREPVSDPRSRTIYPSSTYQPDAHERRASEDEPFVPGSENPDADARVTAPSAKERPRSGATPAP